MARVKRPAKAMVGNIYFEGEAVAPFWCDIEMEITLNKYAPYDIFQMKEQILEQANKSQEIWDIMDDEEKDFQERLMREALEVLHENVPMWLPQALIDGDDNTTTIQFNIVNTEINRFIEGVKFKSELRNEKIKEGLQDRRVEMEEAMDNLPVGDEEE